MKKLELADVKNIYEYEKLREETRRRISSRTFSYS